jgi:hypothetical protein
MPPTPLPDGTLRSAAVWNEAIRALARQAWGRPFTDAERVEYQRLVVGWETARRAEVVKAA